MEKNLIIAEQTSQLGYGVNILTGEVLGTCLDIESINLPDNEGNIIDPLEVVSVSSVNELYKYLSISAKVNAVYKMFKGSGGFQVVLESHINRQESHILIRMCIKKPLERMVAKLNSSAIETLNTDNKRFREQFGDKYVRGTIKGGLLYFLISVKMEDKILQEKVSGQIKTSFALSTLVSFKSNIDRIKKEYNKDIELRFCLVQVGGKTPYFFKTDESLDTLLSTITKFNDDVLQHPVTLAVELAPYKTLINFPFSVNTVDIDEQLEALEHFNTLNNEYETLINDISYIQKYPTEFRKTPDHLLLENWKNHFKTEKEKLLKEAKRCATLNKFQQPSDSIVMPLGFQLPIEIGYVPYEESLLLGKKWIEKEGGKTEAESRWTGVWERQERSRFF